MVNNRKDIRQIIDWSKLTSRSSLDYIKESITSLEDLRKYFHYIYHVREGNRSKNNNDLSDSKLLMTYCGNKYAGCYSMILTGKQPKIYATEKCGYLSVINRNYKRMVKYEINNFTITTNMIEDELSNDKIYFLWPKGSLREDFIRFLNFENN